MGKIRVNTLGDENLEQKQKIKAEKRKEAKASNDASHSAEATRDKEEKISENPSKIRENHAVKNASVDKQKNKHSKRYTQAVMKVEKNKVYSLSEALEILPQIHLAKFDETVELHINTHTTGISGSVTLPHGTGKQVRVAILAPSKDEKAANDLLKEIESGSINFDVLIATPDAMPKLAKFARVLGPRGLMPNPKNGTVTPKPEEVAKKFAGGQINFKTEAKAAVIHMSVGKLSFTSDQLSQNIKIAAEAVQSKNIKNITLKSTMSPGIKISL